MKRDVRFQERTGVSSTRYSEVWVTNALDKADAAIASGDLAALPGALAPLPQEMFMLLYFDRPAQWPHLSAWLPKMPAEDVQKLWTGNTGFHVMHAATAFLDDVFAQVRKPSADLRVLDYGCGWGRMIRLLYQRVRLGGIHGVDPQQISLDHVHACGVHGQFALIDPTPKALPFDGPFDLIYAFSVFTHIGPDAQAAALSAMRDVIAKDGLLAVTIRPANYWSVSPTKDEDVRARMLAAHQTHGFAFHAHRNSQAQALDYGEVSMSVDYIQREWKDWRVDGVQWRARDEHQLYVFLRPA